MKRKLTVYPAIDFSEGKCVRLLNGRFDKMQVYEGTPVEKAKSFADEGAEWIHMVDMDAVRDPSKYQKDVLRAVIEESGLKVQMGGGIRNPGRLEELYNLGVSRVVVGSMAVTAPALIKQWLRHYGGERLTLAFDVVETRGIPYVMIDGWRKKTPVGLWSMLKVYKDEGLRHCLCTDVRRDGALSGPSFSLYNEMIRQAPKVEVQASGGVTTLSDIEQLKLSGVHGVVVGKALYEGYFRLREIISLC
jgi:phosphoribosylformimino-5-aminoimidazole carboxamide ribotide isomerase